MKKAIHAAIAATLLVMGGTAFASELRAYASACLSDGWTHIAPCPSIDKGSPSLIPNEELQSESIGRFVRLASPDDPTSANIALSALSKARADYGSLGVYSAVGSVGHTTNLGAFASAEAGSWFTDTLGTADQWTSTRAKAAAGGEIERSRSGVAPYRPSAPGFKASF